MTITKNQLIKLDFTLIDDWTDEGNVFEIYSLKNEYGQHILCTFNDSKCEMVELSNGDIYNDTINIRNCKSIAGIEKLIKLLND